MTSKLTELVLAVAALVVAPLVGYITASRKLSGKIGTSDAARLWEASETMRKEYRDDLAAANKRVVALEERVANLEAINNGLVRENLALHEQIDELKRRG